MVRKPQDRHLPVEKLWEVLRYEPSTGLLYWRARSPDMFKSDDEARRISQCSGWNKRFAGKPAFNTPTANGYHLAGCVFDERHLAHCVIWAMIHGRWPTMDVDHIDKNGRNNRPRNLRHKTHSDNMKNSKLSASNKSGVPGVYWHSGKGRWQAQINHLGRRIHLGNFPSLDEATAARRTAERQYDFHPNHGRCEQCAA